MLNCSARRSSSSSSQSPDNSDNIRVCIFARHFSWNSNGQICVSWFQLNLFYLPGQPRARPRSRWSGRWSWGRDRPSRSTKWRRDRRSQTLDWTYISVHHDTHHTSVCWDHDCYYKWSFPNLLLSPAFRGEVKVSGERYYNSGPVEDQPGYCQGSPPPAPRSWHHSRRINKSPYGRVVFTSQDEQNVDKYREDNTSAIRVRVPRDISL